MATSNGPRKLKPWKAHHGSTPSCQCERCLSHRENMRFLRRTLMGSEKKELYVPVQFGFRY